MTKEELEAFLKRHALDHEEFAELLGVTRQAVWHWLNEERSISLTVGRLCRMFDRKPELMREFVS